MKIRNFAAWYASTVPAGWLFGLTSIIAFITKSYGQIALTEQNANWLSIGVAGLGLLLVILYLVSRRFAKIKIGLVHPDMSCSDDTVDRNYKKCINIDEMETEVLKCCVRVPAHIDEYMIEFSENDQAYSLGIGGLDGPPTPIYGNRIYCDANHPEYDFQLQIEPLSSGTSEMVIRDIYNNVKLGTVTISLPSSS